MNLDIPKKAPPPDHRPLGQKLRKIREGAGVSLREIARRMGYSASYLSDLEQGKRLWTERKRDDYLAALTE